jgi:hypothetical protein
MGRILANPPDTRQNSDGCGGGSLFTLDTFAVGSFGDNGSGRHHQPIGRVLVHEAHRALGQRVEPLVHPAVKAIKRGGMLILGEQEVRSSLTERQAWWCVPGPMDDTTVPA